MSQYNPNLNQSLVDARLAARVAEASRSRLVGGKAKTRKSSRRERRAVPQRAASPQPQATDLTQGHRQLTLIR